MGLMSLQVAQGASERKGCEAAHYRGNGHHTLQFSSQQLHQGTLGCWPRFHLRMELLVQPVVRGLVQLLKDVQYSYQGRLHWIGKIDCGLHI